MLITQRQAQNLQQKDMQMRPKAEQKPLRRDMQALLKLMQKPLHKLMRILPKTTQKLPQKLMRIALLDKWMELLLNTWAQVEEP
jgi:hypothetical protein